MRILLVEDNRDLAANLLDYLDVCGCRVDYAASAEELKNRLSVSSPEAEYDAAILDVTLPGENGLQLCRWLRQTIADFPVIFLTARDQLDDKREGYDAGADDYLVKPFAMAELWMRLQALSRRQFLHQGDELSCADLVFNRSSKTVTRAGRELKLNRSEKTLLQCLLQYSPKLVSRATLEYSLWQDQLPDSDALRSHIYHLRSKVDKPFSLPLIKTVSGQGFYLSADMA